MTSTVMPMRMGFLLMLFSEVSGEAAILVNAAKQAFRNCYEVHSGVSDGAGRLHALHTCVSGPECNAFVGSCACLNSCQRRAVETGIRCKR